MPRAKKIEPEERHRCAECKLFVRDTSGISFHVDTGEYFMGVCRKGFSDGFKKVFADKLRVCIDFQNNEQHG